MLSLIVSHLYSAANFSWDKRLYFMFYKWRNWEKWFIFFSSELILLKWKAYLQIKSSDPGVGDFHLIHVIKVSSEGLDSPESPQITFRLQEWYLLKVNVLKIKSWTCSWALKVVKYVQGVRSSALRNLSTSSVGNWASNHGRESRRACRVSKSEVKLVITTKDDLCKSINQTDTTSEISTFFPQKCSAFNYRCASVVPSSSSDAFFWTWSIGAIAWGHLTALSIGGLCQWAYLPTQHSQDEQALGMSPIFISVSTALPGVQLPCLQQVPGSMVTGNYKS